MVLKGTIKKQISDLDKVLKIDPNNTQALLTRGQAYYFENRPKEAIKDLKKVIDTDNKIADAWYYAGLSYEKLGRIPLSLICLVGAHNIAPNDPDINYELGVRSLKLGNKKEAIKYFKLFIKNAEDWHAQKGFVKEAEIAIKKLQASSKKPK